MKTILYSVQTKCFCDSLLSVARGYQGIRNEVALYCIYQLFLSPDGATLCRMECGQNPDWKVFLKAVDSNTGGGFAVY